MDGPIPLRDKFWQRFLLERKFRWLRHLTLFFVFCYIYVINPHDRGYTPAVNMYAGFVDVTYLMLIFFINIYILVPRLLLKGRITWYFICTSLFGLLTFCLICLAEMLLSAYRVSKDPLLSDNILPNLLYFLIIFGIIIAITTATRIFQNWIVNLEKLNATQKSNFEHELAILKSQVSPHLLFNVLNNTHILISEDPSKAASLLMNLSDILRYQLYGCPDDMTLVSADIHFLKNLLLLEASRRDNFKFELINPETSKDLLIPSMLFIPFVENAIKHSPQNNTDIRLRFEVSATQIDFKCVNTKSTKQHKRLPDTASGIGLPNIRRRLDLLFPGKHALRITEDENYFDVYLSLIIDK